MTSADIEESAIRPESLCINETETLDFEEAKAGTTALEREAENSVQLDDGQDYPHGSKLALLTLALCLAVFLFALVCRCHATFRKSRCLM